VTCAGTRALPNIAKAINAIEVAKYVHFQGPFEEALRSKDWLRKDRIPNIA